MKTTLNNLKIKSNLERLIKLEPNEKFWEEFAEKQLKKMNNLTKIRKKTNRKMFYISPAEKGIPGESIQGTY